MAASSALSVTELNNVKVYNLTSGKTLPEWLAQKTRTSLKKDEGTYHRLPRLLVSALVAAHRLVSTQTIAAASSSCRISTLTRRHRACS